MHPSRHDRCTYIVTTLTKIGCNSTSERHREGLLFIMDIEKNIRQTIIEFELEKRRKKKGQAQ
jgi:hypothetical protein